jgi:hypothetical protein
MSARAFRCLALLLVVAGLAAGGAVASTRTRAVAGVDYTTRYPASLQLHRTSSLFDVTLTSGPPLDVVGIPRRPGIGITLGTAAGRRMAKALGRPLPANLRTLARMVIGEPAAASQLRVVTALHATKLGGLPAVAEALGYHYHGRSILQRDVLSRRKGRIAFIEADTDASRNRAGHRALQTTLAHWRWR